MNPMVRVGSPAIALVLALAAVAVRAAEPAPTAAADVTAVRHALMAQFDKPEARLDVQPVAVSGDAAVPKFSTFDGFLRMDPHGNHPPAHKH